MIVLDASALIDVVLDQRAADWVLTQIDDGDVHAPAHQPAEVISALARLVRGGDLESAAARDALDEAMALPQEFVAPTPAHVRQAFALRDRIRVVDGLYVALAQDLDCPLVTTDRRLAGATPPVRGPRAALLVTCGAPHEPDDSATPRACTHCRLHGQDRVARVRRTTAEAAECLTPSQMAVGVRPRRGPAGRSGARLPLSCSRPVSSRGLTGACAAPSWR